MKIFNSINTRSCLMALAISLVCVSLSWAAKPDGKGGGKKPPPEPAPLPNVRYTIHWIPYPSGSGLALSMNNHGQVVGLHNPNGVLAAFIYDINTGVFADLNSLVSLPNGKHISSAREINDRGAIVGTVPEEDGNRGCLIYLPQYDPSSIPDAPSEFAMLPGQGSAKRVNNLGDVLQVVSLFDVSTVYNTNLYDTERDPSSETISFSSPVGVGGNITRSLNNFGQVAGVVNNTLFLYDPAAGFTYYPDMNFRYVNGLSDTGVICGDAKVQHKPGGLKRTAVRFVNGQLQKLAGPDTGASSVNESSDVAIIHYLERRASLYHHDDGLIQIADLLVDANPNDGTDDTALWASGSPWITSITDRNVETDYPLMTGSLENVPQAGGGYKTLSVILIPHTITP